MTPRLTIRLLLGALLVLPLAATAEADSTPEAQKWIDKLTEIYDRGSFKVEYEAELDMSGLGQPLSGTLKGKASQADDRHSRLELAFDMAAPEGMPEGGMSMSVLMVKDGTRLWTETRTLAGCQVTEASLVEQASDAPGGMDASPAAMDPVAQLENLSRTMDFEVVEKAGGTVTLHGKVTDETRAELGMLAVPGVDGFLIVVDRKTGFPTEVRAEGEPPFVTLHFRNLEQLDAASLPAGLFDYSRPQDCP